MFALRSSAGKRLCWHIPRLGNKLDAPRGPIERASASSALRYTRSHPDHVPASSHSSRNRSEAPRRRSAGAGPQAEALGAKLHGRVLEQNTLYDTPDSDFRSPAACCGCASRPRRPRSSLPGGARCAILTSKAPFPNPAARSRYKERLERELRSSASPAGHQPCAPRLPPQLPLREISEPLSAFPACIWTSMKHPSAHSSNSKARRTPSIASPARSDISRATTFAARIGISMPPIAAAAAAIPRNMLFRRKNLA